MRVFRGFDELPIFRNSVVTIGSFDGLHRGHLSLIERLLKEAKECDGESVVLTFDRHPRVVLGRADGLRLLTSLDEKSLLLEAMGVDNLIVIPFDRDFSRVSQEEFVKRYLVDKVGVNSLVMGYNHRLGRGDDGTHEDLVALSRECGFSIVEVDEWRDDECGNVSSTVVRRLISRGEIEQANSLLSRPYMILGRVDEDRRVWVDDVLKIEPPKGRYSVLVNGVESVIEVDDNGIITLICSELESKSVRVEVLSRV